MGQAQIKQNAYRKYISQEPIKIAKYAAEHSNSAAINHFKSKNLKEGAVRTGDGREGG